MFQELLEQISLGLDALRIPYMVIGGQAALLYGEPRFTRDIDVTVGVGPERLADLLSLAKERNWRVLSENPPDFVRTTLVLPCLEPRSGLRVDFVFGVSAYEQQAIERVRREPIGNAQVRFASVEDVIIHKIVAGRPRDLEDARIILTKQKTLETDYVRHWLRAFESSLGEKFCERFEAVWNAARGPK